MKYLVIIVGRKELLGLGLSESEGAIYWLSVLTDLHNRGVEDILIACVDGLTGFPEAIASIYPDTEVQQCVIHQIRMSMKNENSLLKLLYAGMLNAFKKWTIPIQNWALTLSQLVIHFEGRLGKVVEI